MLVRQRSENVVADQVGSFLLSSSHNQKRIGNDFFISQALPSHFRIEEGTDETITRMLFLVLNSSAKIGSHLLQATNDLLNVLKVILEVTEYFAEVVHPHR